MKKKFLTMLLASLISLSALTGCKTDKEPAKPETTVEETTETKEPERPEDAPSQKTMNTIPENTPIMAPAVDADGNLPEDFNPDEYYSGYVEEETSSETPKGEASATSEK